MKRNAAVVDFLRPLCEVESQAFISNELQLADIIEWVVPQIGRCELLQSSFSVSEEFLRRLYFMKARRLITDIKLVLDHKATNMTLKLWVFISELVRDTFLADNHSKVLLFKAESGLNVSVVTSQNLTRGNRFESTLVSTAPHIFASLQDSLLDVIRNKSVPLSELLQNALA